VGGKIIGAKTRALPCEALVFARGPSGGSAFYAFVGRKQGRLHFIAVAPHYVKWA
jgi:hypothetical protein